MQAYDHFFAEAQTNVKVIEKQWEVINNSKFENQNLDYFIDNYLTKPLKNENKAVAALILLTQSKNTILKLACILINNEFDLKFINSKPLNENVEFKNPQQESELNDDVLDEIDAILEKKSFKIEFVNEFVPLFFYARQVR